MKHLIAIIVSLCLAFMPIGANAVSLIRDAEIEDTLHTYGEPIFKKAGLNNDAIHIFIVDDLAINAFVAGGANMFIHTGLILKTTDPAMLIGVMAHETGHMAGGHLAQGSEKIQNAQMGAIFSAVLGAAVAVGGSADAGMAVISGGQELAMRNFLRFTRGNESAADQAGLNYLDALGISASGMLRILEILRQDENRSYGNPDPYTRTHPLNIDRITHIRNHVMQSKIKEDALPSGYVERHARMLAKLSGFIKTPEQTLLAYPVSDNSIPAHYARAIAYYKIPDLPKSLAEMDILLKLKPNDPFFNELRGQILFENGHIDDSIKSYAKASALLPRSPLIMSDYGKVLIASESKDNLAKAVKILEKSTSIDNSNIDTWHNLAIAYGKSNNLGMFYLATAEENLLADNIPETIKNADLALKNIVGDKVAKLRANDIKIIAEKEKAENRK